MDVQIKEPLFKAGYIVTVATQTRVGQVRRFEGCKVRIESAHASIQLGMDANGLTGHQSRWLYGGEVIEPEDRRGEAAYDLEIEQLTLIEVV